MELDFYLDLKNGVIRIMEKEKVYIILEGCDDETEFPMDFTKEEVELVKRISEKSKAESLYGCMPVLNLYTGEDAVEKIRGYENAKAEEEEEEEEQK